MMPVGQDASVWVRCKVLPQPGLFRRTLPTAAQLLDSAVRVQNHDVPSAQVVAVITFLRFASLLAPVKEIPRRVRTVVLVITRSRFGPLLETPPGRLVAILEFLVRAFLVGKIAFREDGPRNIVDQLGGGLRSNEVATPGDISRSDQSESAWILPCDRLRVLFS